MTNCLFINSLENVVLCVLALKEEKSIRFNFFPQWHSAYFQPIIHVYVVVNFLFQLIFIFALFWGMVMYANEFKTKEKQKLTEIKN